MSESLLERLFLEEGHLTSEQLSFISERRTLTGDGFVAAALDEKLLSFDSLSVVLAKHVRIETCDLTSLAIDADAAKTLGYFYAEKYLALPFRREGNRLWVAMRDPLCERARAGICDLTGCTVEALFARESDIRYHINAVFGSERINSIASRFADDENRRRPDRPYDAALNEQLRNAPAVRLIDSLIESAVPYRASDIHIEPHERELRVRFRVDGRLTAFQRVDITLLPYIISRLKVMGNMDITEKRLPQDGRFTLTVQGESIDFRLSTLPTLYGEKAVIRLLYDRAKRLKKDDLGFFPDDMEELTRLFASPYGCKRA